MMGIGTEMMRIEEMRMECRMTAMSCFQSIILT